MHVTVDRSELDRALAHVARVVAVRQAVPSLSNVLLETDGAVLRLSGTDLDVAVTTSVPALVTQEGTYTVPAKLFQEFVRQDPDARLELKRVGNELVVSGDSVTGRMSGIESDEYPALPTVRDGQRVLVPAAAFTQALKQAVVAVANDPARPVLTGVLITGEGDRLTAAATDSFRLAERTVRTATPFPEPLQLLIPARTVQEVLRVAAAVPAEVIALTIGEAQLVVGIGGVELSSRLLVGAFPKYQAVIPKEYPVELTVPGTELQNALRLSSVFGQAGIANVMLEVAEDGAFTVCSYASQRGATEHALHPVITKQEGPMKAALNARFLLDAATAANADFLTLKFSGPTSPLVILTDDPDYLQLVMPIRVDA